METVPTDSLSALLAASLASAALPPLINAEQAAGLLGCSKEHVEGMADRGELPATKYGRGWIFVTAQLVFHVSQDCVKNMCPGDDTPTVARRRTRRSVATTRSDAEPRTIGGSRLTLEPSALKRGRGRPRRSVPDLPPQT